MSLQDARLYQITFLAGFLLLGMATRDWTLQPSLILTTITTCLTTQAIALWVVARLQQAAIEFSLSMFFSPLVTSLGLSILLRAEHATTMMLAAIVAIASKFLIRFQGKHLFNPGNFGIIAALLLTSDAWVSPGQWGEEGWYAMLFLAAGGIVVQRVGRGDTTIAFLATYAGLEAARNLWLGWTWDVWLHRLMSGSLLMFALFMITDPRTIPNARWARVFWAAAIALLTFILRNEFFLSTAVFWALFVLTPLTIVLDRLFPDDRFVWVPRLEPTQSSNSGASTELEPVN